MNQPVRVAVMSVLCAAMIVVAGCITHSPKRTYDYAEIPRDLPANCKVNDPPPECRTFYLKAACRQITIATQDDGCGVPYGKSPADSRACTSIRKLHDPALRADYPLSEAEYVSCFAHEKHLPLGGGAESIPRHHAGFDAHIIEFDDEGRPWNADRIDHTLAQLQEDLKKPSVVLMFVHGWKNDSDVCNGNLACFREVLEVLAKLEKAFEHLTNQPARRVIGVYVGWRGGSLSTKGVKQFTFWGRKHTAHTIGDNGAVTAFIGRLRHLVNTSPPQIKESRRHTTMVSVGHSFGAALLYSALATSLNRQVGEALQEAGRDEAVPQRPMATAQTRQASLSQALVAPKRCVLVKNTGDIVVLVNPAMEASRFANLNQASQLCYDEKQIPILLTVGSEADYAVGTFFPVGQSFATIFRAARSRDAWLSMAEGFGMYKPYLTHRLSVKRETEYPRSERATTHCGCPSNLASFGDALVMNLKEFHARLETLPRSAAVLPIAAYREFLYSRLEPARDVDANNPFLMIEADREVVGGHSEIFNARFMDFLIEFVAMTELKREVTQDYPSEKRIK